MISVKFSFLVAKLGISRNLTAFLRMTLLWRFDLERYLQFSRYAHAIGARRSGIRFLGPSNRTQHRLLFATPAMFLRSRVVQAQSRGDVLLSSAARCGVITQSILKI